MRDPTGEKTRYWLVVNYGEGYWNVVRWSDKFDVVLNAYIHRCTEDLRYGISCNIKAF